MIAGSGGIATPLIAWAAEHGRRELPWQRDPSPYRVWLSEVMLQQTQVASVIRFYERFIERFPDVATLAAASLDEVLAMWAGLGYYARARNMHRAARLVVERYGGELPDDISLLRRLPGIGRSTAGAILALSRQQRHPILDANARRLLARRFGVETEQGLWALAEACTPRERVAEYTQAVMDLGATVCLPRRPRCHACPLASECVARRTGRHDDLPARRPQRKRPARIAWAVVALSPRGEVLLERRPPSGVWGGLWSFPQFDRFEEALDWLNALLSGVEPTALQPLASQRHVFTHYELTLHLAMVRLARPLPAACIWYGGDEPREIGLSRAVTRVMPALAAEEQLASGTAAPSETALLVSTPGR